MQIELTSRGLLSTLFRHRLKLISSFVVCVALAITYIMTAVPSYESVGSLLVKFGRSATPDVFDFKGGGGEVSQNDRREIMQSNMQIMESRDLLRGLVHEFGVETLYPGLTAKLRPSDNPVEAAITKLQSDDIIAKSPLNSDIIEVRVFNQDPQVAAKFLQKLFDQFIILQSDVYNKAQTDFLAEQVKQAGEKLHQSQKALREYKEQVGISSIDEELRRLLEQRMTASNIALTAMDKAKERLEELEAKETELLATYHPNSPIVQKMRQSIAKARQQVEQRQKDLRDRTKNDEGSETFVSSEMARIQKRIEKLEAVRTRHDDLDRQVKIDEENYKTFATRSEAARVNQTLNEQKITRVTVLDTPMAATRPSRPRKLIVLLFAMMAGAIIGLGAALIAETMDDRFSTPSQLGHSLQLPVLASFFSTRAGK